MTLSELKEKYLNGELNILKVQWQIRHHQEILDTLFPHEGPLAAKFHLYAHDDCSNTDALCDTSMKFKTFYGLGKGFRKFCGNQGSCPCNHAYIQDLCANRSKEDNKQIVQKRKKTNREKYGADFASQTADTKEKSAQTCIQKYGVKAATMNPVVLDKSQQTCVENWGVSFPQQNQEVFSKTRKSFNDLYGVDVPSKNPDVADKVKQGLRELGYNRFLNIENITPLFDKSFYAKSTGDTAFWWYCKKCDSKFEQIIDKKLPRCYSCQPKKETWGETFIKEFLQKNNIIFEQWDRTVLSPKELDFWIPSLNLAIEFNGTWYHREDNVSSRNHHQLKWKLCDEKGIKLIQIWEHELLKSQSIIIDRLTHAINGKTKKIAARKCFVRKITSEQSRDFFNKYHLQGNHPSSYIYGLYDQTNTLVAAASIGKSRYDKKIKWELLRYATISSFSVQGGLGKLLAYAKTDIGFDSIVSYANLNWGKGTIYEKLGFVLQNISKPNYYYAKNDLKIYSRVKFQKHKIIGKAEGNSEKEIAQNMGYFRFFDAGNAVWIKYY